jgi:serine/threonine-protein kinase
LSIKVVDFNTDQYDGGTELYFVAEYIPGPTLATAVKSSRCELETTAKTVIRILDIVVHYHRASVIHRDIKPENIILRNEHFSDPVLVDFGLSFNEEAAEAETLTEPQQGLGNRFLWLPELRVEESAKRDARSDITACCGILFFMLTGMNPTSLSDHEGRKPHQRAGAKGLLDHIENVEKRAIVNTVFDTGFEMQIDRRWQSANALSIQLEKVLNVAASQPESRSLESTIQQMREQLTTSGTYASRQETYALLTNLAQHLKAVHANVAGELGPDFDTLQGNYSLTPATHTNDLGFVHRYYSETPFRASFRAFVTGSEVVLTAQHGGQNTELLRAPLADFTPGQEFRDEIRAYFVRSAAAFFADIVSAS